uniref:EAL domain-containing protein n=1 Tax=Pseudomaricurvus sp. TaxID=2004510 RepID=UPI003F6D8AE7
INISARQMAQENFAEHLISLAEQFEVPLSRLEVELTETSILIDEVLVRQHLYALRTAGVKISLDDFGTGYSSLTFLRSLPIDTVKIDRSFVLRLQDHEESRAIVLSVLELCHKLSLQTVAEGIEEQAQFEILMLNGCDEGQGYLLARPIPAENVLHFLKTPGFDVSQTS